MTVLWLKSQGIKHKDICRLENICSATLVTYLHQYKEGGLEALRTLPFNRPRSDLADHRDTLEAHFRKHPPSSITHAMSVIEQMTGLKRSPERVRVFMRRLGMKCRKVGMIPAKADIVAQEAFKKKSWNRV
jgi:transposase